ncbi:MAG TPA: hypothetical protein V6C95_16885 [Coleofasciculaceae cyanobacterium]
MAELTIQVPDELAQRLEPLRSRLPELLLQLLETTNSSSAIQSNVAVNPQALPSVYLEILDFLIKRPTPSEIAGFKVSTAAQERLRTLLDKNREATLTSSETAELDIYEQLNHLLILLKARAIASLS